MGEDPQDAGEGRAEEQVQAGEAREEGRGSWQCHRHRNRGSTSPSSILWERPRNVQGLRKGWHGRNGGHGDGRNGSWTWGNGREQPRMPTVLLMLLLKLLRQQRKLLLLLACLREVERNTCRGLGTLWLLRSTLLASTCRWMSRLQEGRGPLSSRLPRPT